MFSKETRNTRKVSLTPMIDMVFLLLVFFMLTTTFQRNDGIELNFGLPPEGTKQGKEPLIRVISINADEVMLQGEKMSLATFRETLAEQLEQNPSSRIALSNLSSTTVQDMIITLDTVRQLGASNITLVETKQ